LNCKLVKFYVEFAEKRMQTTEMPF